MTKQYDTAADWLAAWDAGEPVPSVEMGGLGDGYEHAIQVTTAEIIRWLVTNAPDTAAWNDPEKWRKDRDAIEAHLFTLPIIDEQGLSGAQWGAALSLATTFYKRGPSPSMTDAEIADRIIQVTK